MLINIIDTYKLDLKALRSRAEKQIELLESEFYV